MGQNWIQFSSKFGISNSTEFYPNLKLRYWWYKWFHSIKRILHRIPWNLECANLADTSSSMEVNRTWSAPISLTRSVPWNSMELARRLTGKSCSEIGGDCEYNVRGSQTIWGPFHYEDVLPVKGPHYKGRGFIFTVKIPIPEKVVFILRPAPAFLSCSGFIYIDFTWNFDIMCCCFKSHPRQ